MKILCRGGWIYNTDIRLSRQAQEALNAPAGMIGALTLVPVRQEQYQRRSPAPFGAARKQELIDDRLGVIDEVAILRLPDHEAFRRDHIVAHLKSNRSRL